MKKNSLIILFLVLIGTISEAQPFLIGHKQQAFIDASRSNRTIDTEIYYPANTAGDNVPMANGTFPTLVFGHGFVMIIYGMALFQRDSFLYFLKAKDLSHPRIQISEKTLPFWLMQ
jgi:hypothetical protein